MLTELAPWVCRTCLSISYAGTSTKLMSMRCTFIVFDEGQDSLYSHPMHDITPNDTSEWTIGRLLAWTTDFLKRHEIEDARLSAEVLLAGALNCRRLQLYTRFDDSPQTEATTRYRDWVRRAGQHEPVAYIVGEKEFFSLPFYVTRDVLIPRSETETLVECIVDYFRARSVSDGSTPNRTPSASERAPNVRARSVSDGLNQSLSEGFHILDVGTGSGCIIIAALVQLPNAVGVATDISAAALAVARRNAERHTVLDRLTLLEADALNFPGGSVPAGGFDVIVSNPPYIPAQEIPGLKPEVRDYEPRVALTDEANGLSFYGRLAEKAPLLLAPNGRLMVEVGDGQADAVLEVLTAGGTLIHDRTVKDRVTGLERVAIMRHR